MASISASRGVSTTVGRGPGARRSAELRSLGPKRIAFISDACGSDDDVAAGDGCSGAAEASPTASVSVPELGGGGRLLDFLRRASGLSFCKDASIAERSFRGGDEATAVGSEAVERVVEGTSLVSTESASVVLLTGGCNNGGGCVGIGGGISGGRGDAVSAGPGATAGRSAPQRFGAPSTAPSSVNDTLAACAGAPSPPTDCHARFATAGRSGRTAGRLAKSGASEGAGRNPKPSPSSAPVGRTNVASGGQSSGWICGRMRAYQMWAS